MKLCNVCVACGQEGPRSDRPIGPMVACWQCGKVGTFRTPTVAVRELLARIEVLATRPEPPSPCAWPSTTEKPLTPDHPIGCDCHDCNQARIEAAG